MKQKLSSKDYHNSDAISSTDIKNFIESPLYFKIQRQTKQINNAQQKGILLHTLLLEPENLYEVFDVAPDINKNTTIWRARVETAQSKKLLLITQKELQEAQNIIMHTHNHPLIKDILSCDKFAECSFFTKDTETKLPLKARPDLLVDMGTDFVIVDYKTTSGGLDNYTLSNYFRNYKIEIQAAFHSKVIEIIYNKKVSGCVYIIQNVTHPELIRVIQLEDEIINRAKQKVNSVLEEMAKVLGIDFINGYMSLEEIFKKNKITHYEYIEWLNYKTYYND